MTSLFAGIARAVDRHVIAALFCDDLQPTLDQCQILPVLAKQQGCQPVVVESQRDLFPRSPRPRPWKEEDSYPILAFATGLFSGLQCGGNGAHVGGLYRK